MLAAFIRAIGGLEGFCIGFDLLLFGFGGLVGLGRIVAIAVVRTSDELEVFANDTELAAALSVLGLPGVQLEAALDVDGAALGQIFGDGVCHSAEAVYVDEGDFLVLVAVGREEYAVHGDAEFADAKAVGRDPQVRILGEMAD